MTTKLRDHFYQLALDENRKTTGFSDDIRIASEAINFPYANDPQRIDALSGWIQRHQRCAFGNIAAKRDGIHFCFISEKDINTLDDDAVRAKIADSKRLWKQRAFRGVHHGLDEELNAYVPGAGNVISIRNTIKKHVEDFIRCASMRISRPMCRSIGCRKQRVGR